MSFIKMRIAVLFLVSVGLMNILACSNWLELLHQLIGIRSTDSENTQSSKVTEKKDEDEDYDNDKAYWVADEQEDFNSEEAANFSIIAADIETPQGPKLRLGIVQNQLMKGVKAVLSGGQMTGAFVKFLSSIAMPGALRFRNECNCNPLLCIVCQIVVDMVLEVKDDLIKPENIVNLLVQMCTVLQLETEEVCDGTIKLQADTFIYIARKRPDLSGSRVCATMLQDRSCKGRVPEMEIMIPDEITNRHRKRAVDPNKKEKKKKKREKSKYLLGPMIPDEITDRRTKRAVDPDKVRKKKLEKKKRERKRNKKKQRYLLGPRDKTKALKVLHITDIHYDSDYLVGGWGKCKEPLCCQKDKGMSNKSEDTARHWGDFRLCDTPLHTIEMTFQHINQQHPDVDIVYFTGDIVSHKVWGTSKEMNSRDIKQIYDVMDEYFSDIPVVPILGNHEAHPVNGFAPPSVKNAKLENNWLYKLVSEIWIENWLPENTLNTILDGGYYTVEVEPGFRIIALNSNPVYTLNWWILYETNSIVTQLQWLIDTLYDAEQAGEIVHILSHVPSGDDTCYKPYSEQFLTILERFSHIIAGIFVGHTHYDEFLLYRHRETKKPICVAWNGGSLTNYEHMNYNYKIFTVGLNYRLLDYESWIFDLPEANHNPTEMPAWYKLYSFTEAYGVKDLSPEETDEAVYKIARDKKLMQLYHSFKNRRPDWEGDCNFKCRVNHICGIVTTVHGETKYCREMKQELPW